MIIAFCRSNLPTSWQSCQCNILLLNWSIYSSLQRYRNKYFRLRLSCPNEKCKFWSCQAFNSTVDLMSVAELRYVRDSFLFHSFCAVPGLHKNYCLWFTLLMKCWQICLLLIAQPALMAIITLSLSIRDLCNVIRPPLPWAHTHIRLPCPSPPEPVGSTKFTTYFFMPL